MRPNLSFEHFAAVLGAIGATALVACGASEPQPVQANEVAPATSAAATTGQASCSAAGCGANKTGNAPAMPAASAAAPATSAAAATSPAVDAPVAAAAASAAPAAPASPTAVTKPVAKKKKAMPSGEASCGAGTCSSNTKQIL